MNRRALGVLLAMLGGVAHAEGEPDPRDKRIEELEQRVDQLENSRETLDDAVEDYASEAGLGLNIVLERGDARGNIQIFGDVGGAYANPASAGRAHASFFNGSLALFFRARVGDNFHVLTETVFQTKVGNATTGDSSKFDQERLWAAWTFSDAIKVKFGLEHGPISLWNALYHHGRWLELTITRPMVAAFESGSGILPMHEAGIEIYGDIPVGAGSVSYVFFVSNGRGVKVTDVSEFSDPNNDKAFTFGGGYHFDSADTIFIGIFARTDELPADASDPARARPIREWIVSLQVQVQTGLLDVLSEVALISNDDRTSGASFESYTGYIQVGVHVDDQFTPYLRIDFREMAVGDPYYMPAGRDLDVLEGVFGVRFDAQNNLAIKLEVAVGDRESRGGGGAVSTGGYIRVAIQVAFVF